MMNYIFFGMLVLSVICALFTGNMENLSSSVLEAGGKAIETLFSIAGVMCLWTGIMKIAEKSGLAHMLARFIEPFFKMLFKEVKNKETKNAITLNLCANFLGMGNAATPFGVKAISLLNEENKKSKRASNPMCMLVVLNTASIQLIPATLLALMKKYGDLNPYNIIPYVWLCSALSVIAGIIVAKRGEKKL